MVRIAHLADIHIQDRRRVEYAAVFAALYASLRAEAPAIIVVAGDVFDSKMRATPNNMADVIGFLAALAEVAPVVLIPGNHDCNQLTPGALDLLTPLLADHQTLRPPRLTYWRGSGVYVAHGIVWTVIATDGDRPPEAVELAAAAEHPAAPRVCLFHEEVNGALLPSGAVLRGFKLDVASLAGYDAALGGHIHCRQRFTARAGYCGSLVQQNVGEPHRGHGYVLWELTPSAAHPPHRTAPPTVRGVDIPNDAGFVRVEVDARGADVTARPLPTRPIYWELAHDPAAPPARVAEHVAAHELAFGMPPRAVRLLARTPAAAGEPAALRPNPGGPAPAADPAADAAEAPEAAELAAMADAQSAARALDAHKEIIGELLAASPVLPEVLALHEAHYAEVEGLAATRSRGVAGARFRLVRLEFDNMYKFGPGNVVDFTRLEAGVSGVIARNHTGKSSLIDALLFALYEEAPRADTKANVVRRGAGGCRLALDFELDGQPGRIEKTHLAGRVHTASSEYRFYFAGEDRTLGGTTETLGEIRRMLGGPATALASSFQLQDKETGGFIGAAPAARKKLLAAALELGSFEALERTVTKELTAAGAEARVLAAQFRGQPAAELAAREAVERAAAAAAAAAAARLETAETEAALAARAAAAEESRTAAAAAAAREKASVLAADPAAAARAPLLARLTAEKIGPAHSARAVIAWAAAVGGDAPAADHAAMPIAPSEPGSVPTPAELAEATRWASVAAARFQLAAEAVTAAEEKVKQSRGGAASASQRKEKAAARLTLAKAALIAATARATESGPASAWPELLGWAGERSGPRPEAAEVSAARARIGQMSEAAARTALERLARTRVAWNPLAYEAARAESGAMDPEAAKLVAERAAAAATAAAARLAAAVSADTAATAALACQPPGARAAAASHPDAAASSDPAALTAATRALSTATAWATAAKHLAAIRARHSPTPGCRGCAAMTALLSPEAEALAATGLAAAEEARAAALAGAYRAAAERAQAAASELREASAAHAAALSAGRAAQATAAAAKKARELETARAASAEASELEAALSALDRAAYWARRDCEAAKLRAAEEAHARDELRAEVHAATEEEARADAELSAASGSSAAALGAAARAGLVAARAGLEAAAAEKDRTASLLEAASAKRAQARACWAWWLAAVAALEQASSAEAASRAAAETTAAAAEAARVSAAAATAAAEARATRVASLRAEASAAREAGRLAAALEAELEREGAHTAASRRHSALKAYRAVLRPTGGIGDRLLERARPLLARRINEGLLELGARFAIAITPDFDVFHRDREFAPGAALDPPESAEAAAKTEWLPAALASGYQRFVLNLAARLAIWRLSAAPRPDALIVDEGFGACDEEYLEAMATALETLATAPGAPRLIFIVSHLDALKARLALERTLSIETGPGGSHIENAPAIGLQRERPGADISTPRPPSKPRAPGVPKPRVPAPPDAVAASPTELPADPESPGHVWCEVCRQSLKAGWGRRHLSSARHTAALTRFWEAGGRGCYEDE